MMKYFKYDNNRLKKKIAKMVCGFKKQTADYL